MRLALGRLVALLAGAALGLAPAGEARSEDAVRVGYFANLTHAPVLVGLARGDFAAALGPGVTIETRVFNAGPAQIEALFAGEIDVGYVGASPAINGFVRSKGRALRVVAGAASGGASLVVRRDSGVESPADLEGKRLAAPQIGNTQDVALRLFLRDRGIVTRDRGGATLVLPIANGDLPALFDRKQIDGAWVPEPWATILRRRDDARELVDERSLWPEGRFPTTVVIAASRFAGEHPEILERWLRAHLRSVAWIRAHPAEARRVVNDALRRLTTREIAPEVLDEAWSRLEFDAEPIPEAFARLAAGAKALGYLPREEIDGLFDLRALERARAVEGH